MATLEETQAENIRLSAEVQQLKSSQSLEIAKAVKIAEDRFFGILEAAKTFSIPNDTAIKFAKGKSSLDDVVTSFELIKETSQASTHVDTSGEGFKQGGTSELLSGTAPLTPTKTLLKMSEQFTPTNIFEGLM